jgi:predicted nucleic acid-binding protein
MTTAYLDASVAIEYLNADGAERDDDLFAKKPATREALYLIKLLRSQRNYQLAVEMRRRINSGKSKLAFVISPLVWIEVQEWIAEEKFKAEAAAVTLFTQLQREGKKRIGDLLKTIRYDSDQERATFNPAAAALFQRTTATSERLTIAGLRGTIRVDLCDFTLSAADIQIAVNLAYMQVGLADIMHLLVSKHLGCKYFVTLDSDFQRVRDAIMDSLGIEVLFRDEVLDRM